MSLLLGLLLLIDGFLAASAAFGRAVGKRRTEQAMLLWAMAIATRLGLPMDEEVRSLKPQFRRKRRRDLDRFADLLKEGVPLTDALDSRPGLLSGEARLAIQVGERTGLLSEAIEREATRAIDFERLRRPLRETMEGSLVYLTALLVIGGGIVSFIMVSIIPKFKKIFEDFGTELPETTRFAIGVFDFLSNSFWLFFLFGVTILGPLFWISLIRRGGWTSVDPPLFERWLVRFDVPAILRQLSLQAEYRQPLLPAVEAMAGHFPRRSTARRLQQAVVRMEQGMEDGAALASAGLLRTDEAEAIQAAAQADHLAWALQELSLAIDRRISGRLRWVSEWVSPFVVVPVSLFVLLVAVAFFLPLVKLIADLSVDA